MRSCETVQHPVLREEMAAGKQTLPVPAVRATKVRVPAKRVQVLRALFHGEASATTGAPSKPMKALRARGGQRSLAETRV